MRRTSCPSFWDLKQIYNRREQCVGECVRLQSFENAELVEHDFSIAERNHLQIDAGLEFAVLHAYGACKDGSVRKLVQRKARHDRCGIVVQNVCSAEYRQKFGILGQVVQARFVRASRPVRFDGAVELVALVQEVDVFGSHVGEQQGLSAVLGDFDDLVENFVGPGAQVCSEDNLFRSFEGGHGVAGFFAVVEEADFLDGVLYVGLFRYNQVFACAVDFLAVVEQGELNLVLAQVARGDNGADAELRQTGLAGLFFGFLLLSAQHLAVCVNNAYFDYGVFKAAVVQKRELEADFALGEDHVLKFADEDSARSCDFLDERFEALALAVFIAKTAEVCSEVGPVVQEESGNLRVALQGRYLVQLALDGNAVDVFAEFVRTFPHGEVRVFDESFDLLVEVLDCLLVLDAPWTGDGGCLCRKEGVVLEGDEHLVFDAFHRVFVILEVAVAKAGVRHHQFVFVLVEHVGEVVAVGCVDAELRVDLERRELRNVVVRYREHLSGILVESGFVVDIDAVQVAYGRAAHVNGADGVQELVAVLQHERSVFASEHPDGDARMVVLFPDDVVDEPLCDFDTLGSGPHGVDRKFLEYQKTNLVANVESFVAERCAAAADGVEACLLDGHEVVAELGIVCCPKAAFAPLLVVAHALDFENLVVQVEVALEAVKFAERESPHDGEAEILFLALGILALHLDFDGEHVRLVRTPNAFVLLPVLDAEGKALRCVFAVELDSVLVPFVHVADGIAHQETQAGLEIAGVVEADFDGDSFLVHVGFDAHVRNKCRVSEDEVHVSENASERILRPGEADRHVAWVYIAVVGTVGAFATEVDAAVGGAHVCDAHAENIFFAELYGLLGFNDKRRVCAKVVAQELSVEPDGGMRGYAFKTQEDSLGDLLFVFDGKALEIIGAVLGHQKFFEFSFPNVGNLNSFSVFRVCRVPAIGDSKVFSVPNHLPIAVKAHNLVHVGLSFVDFA